MRSTIALFGEAEKGDLAAPVSIQSLDQLSETFGHAPKETRGIFFAVQFLLYQHELIYIRVQEEGFSTKSYLKGFKQLSQKGNAPDLTAICLPGVGDTRIFDACQTLCNNHRALLITTEQDFYDYLTSLHLPPV